jgi:hypothetical protein
MTKKLTPIEQFVKEKTKAGLEPQEIHALLEVNGLKKVSRPRIYQIQEKLGLRERQRSNK